MNNSGHIKLTSIVQEIKREQRRAIKETRKYVMSSITINEIINSNGLLKNETIALKKFFEYYNNGNIPVLNESTIKLIDTHLKSSILSEGFSDWAKKVGAKAKEWLSSGWESVKKVWSNFKDVVSVVIEKIKEFFKDLAAAAWDKVKALGSTLKTALEGVTEDAKEHLDKFSNDAITKEWNVIKESVIHLGNKITAWQRGEGWQSEVLSGNAKPVGDTNEPGGDMTESTKPKLIFDKSLIESLLNLTEAYHMEDLINKDKYPVLHKILKWTLELIGWVFSPINTILKYLVKYLVGGPWKKDSDGKAGILYWINSVAEKLGGPAAIGYPILGFLCAELTEAALSGLQLKTHGKMLGALHVGIEAIDKLGINIWEWLHDAIKKYAPGLGTAITVVEIVCLIYALGNFVFSVFPGYLKKINPNIHLAH